MNNNALAVVFVVHDNGDVYDRDITKIFSRVKISVLMLIYGLHPFDLFTILSILSGLEWN